MRSLNFCASLLHHFVLALWLRPNEPCSPGAVLNGRSLHHVSLSNRDFDCGFLLGFGFFSLGGHHPGLNDLLGRQKIGIFERLACLFIDGGNGRVELVPDGLLLVVVSLSLSTAVLLKDSSPPLFALGFAEFAVVVSVERNEEFA